jgi:uncharacterized protein
MKLYRSIAALSLWLAGMTVGFALTPELEQVTVGPAIFQVEMARTPQERQRGLMFRQELPQDRGMLFVQSPGPVAFWMKNTYIPLDLLYFDADGRLLQIEAGVPPCKTPNCPIYPSATATVQYILEINAGEAARRGIQVGDRLRLE